MPLQRTNRVATVRSEARAAARAQPAPPLRRTSNVATVRSAARAAQRAAPIPPKLQQQVDDGLARMGDRRATNPAILSAYNEDFGGQLHTAEATFEGMAHKLPYWDLPLGSVVRVNVDCDLRGDVVTDYDSEYILSNKIEVTGPFLNRKQGFQANRWLPAHWDEAHEVWSGRGMMIPAGKGVAATLQREGIGLDAAHVDEVMATMREWNDDCRANNRAKTLIGHSLGGVTMSLAQEDLLDCGDDGFRRGDRLYTYETPALTRESARKLNAAGCGRRTTHILNQRDPVPLLGEARPAGAIFKVDSDDTNILSSHFDLGLSRAELSYGNAIDSPWVNRIDIHDGAPCKVLEKTRQAVGLLTGVIDPLVSTRRGLEILREDLP